MFALADFHQCTHGRATAVGTEERWVWSVTRWESQPKRMEMQFFANPDASHLHSPSNYKPRTLVDRSRIWLKLLTLAIRTVPNSILCQHLTPPTTHPTGQQSQATARPKSSTQQYQISTILVLQHVLGGTVCWGFHAISQSGGNTWSPSLLPTPAAGSSHLDRAESGSGHCIICPCDDAFQWQKSRSCFGQTADPRVEFLHSSHAIRTW